MNNLPAEKRHLSGLLEAVQRCCYFLHAAQSRLPTHMMADWLEPRKKDIDVFSSLAAVNERFAKLQDTLASAMRHAASLSGEKTDTFLRVLSFYEKVGVIPSIETWQEIRSFRNASAHDYETDYQRIAEHFNTLNALTPGLLCAANRFNDFCGNQLGVVAFPGEFQEEFLALSDRREPT